MTTTSPAAGRLVEPTTGVSLAVPYGWVVVPDVGAATCVSAVSAQADVTGRVLAPGLRVAPVHATGWFSPLSHRRLDDQLVEAAADLVRGATAGDPHAWLVDARRWSVQTAEGASVPAVRVDLSHLDATTPMLSTVVLLPTARGVVGITAAVPVAHQRGVRAAVEVALGSVLTQTVPEGVGDGVPTHRLGDLAASRLPVQPRGWLSVRDLELFVTGSHKIARAARPGAAQAGLATPSGTATPLGQVVRQGWHRPDVRAELWFRGPDGAPLAGMIVDRVAGWAVLRATAALSVATVAPGDDRWVDVVDVAAAPGRVAAWLGTGPLGSFTAPDGVTLAVVVHRSGAPGTRPLTESTVVPRGAPARETWALLLGALV